MTEENNQTEETELSPQDQEFALLAVHGAIFNRLLQHPKFQTFLLANYEIKDPEPSEEGFVTVNVREKTPQEVQLFYDKMTSELGNRIQVVDESALKNLNNQVKPIILNG